LTVENVGGTDAAVADAGHANGLTVILMEGDARHRCIARALDTRRPNNRSSTFSFSVSPPYAMPLPALHSASSPSGERVRNAIGSGGLAVEGAGRPAGTGIPEGGPDVSDARVT